MKLKMSQSIENQSAGRAALMDKIVSLCKRRGFLFQSSEIYGGINGFWDYGPLGVELKRNLKNAWWEDMIRGHNDLDVLPGAPDVYSMTGIDCTIIMHPQVWKCSGHYDLFHDMMQSCQHCKKLFRADHVAGLLFESEWVASLRKHVVDFAEWTAPLQFEVSDLQRWLEKKAKHVAPGLSAAQDVEATISRVRQAMATGAVTAQDLVKWIGYPTVNPRGLPCPACGGQLNEPREFNLMFQTYTGALQSDENLAFLRPETAQGIFVNFKNVLDSSRFSLPLGIAQIGKSFRNEITPRNFTFRSREFEQMEIEFFCHPEQSSQWYRYWRDRRLQWYQDLGIGSQRLILREHEPEELAHYSVGTADIEYAFPFLPAGEFGELEGIAHRGDFDLRSHMEGKLDEKERPLKVQLNEAGQPKYRGSGKDLSYRDALTNEKYIPHVIEPSAGADRATLAFICEAYTEDQAPDENGALQTRVVMKFHPRLAPIKAAVFPLVKKDGMPELAKEIYLSLKRHWVVFYDEKGAVGRRYRRQDEAGTPYCITVDGQSLQDRTVTLRDRDTLEQVRVPMDQIVSEIGRRIDQPWRRPPAH
jgi:glycyl-tRNA synthetase